MVGNVPFINLILLILILSYFILNRCNGRRGWFPSNYVEIIKETDESDKFQLWELQQQMNLNQKQQRVTDTRLSIYDNSPWIIQTTEDGSEQYYYNTQTQEMRYSIPSDFYDHLSNKMKETLVDNNLTESYNNNGNLLSYEMNEHYELSPPVRPVRAVNRMMVNDTLYNQQSVDYHTMPVHDKNTIASPSMSQQHLAMKNEPFEVDFEDHEKLPPNWIRKMTSKGRYYYYNFKSNEITWELENIDPDTGILLSSFADSPNYQQNYSYRSTDINEEQSDRTSSIYSDENLPISWQSLSSSIAHVISRLKDSIRQGDNTHFVQDVTSIVHRIRLLLYVSNCLEKETSIHLRSNKQLRNLHRNLLAALAKLVLSTKVASSAWSPPESLGKLQSDAEDLLIAARNFIIYAQELQIEIKENKPTLSSHDHFLYWRSTTINSDNNSSLPPFVLKNPASHQIDATNAILVLADNVRGAVSSYMESIHNTFLHLENENLKDTLSKLKANAPLLVAQFRNLSHTTSHFLNAVEEMGQRRRKSDANTDDCDTQLAMLFHSKQPIYTAMGSLFVISQTITNSSLNANQIKLAYDQLKQYVNSIEVGIQHVIDTCQTLNEVPAKLNHKIPGCESIRNNASTPIQRQHYHINTLHSSPRMNHGRAVTSTSSSSNRSPVPTLSDTDNNEVDIDNSSENLIDTAKQLDTGSTLFTSNHTGHHRILSDDMHILSDDGNDDNDSFHSDMTANNHTLRLQKEAKITKFFGEDTIAAAVHYRDTLLNSPTLTQHNDVLSTVATHITGASSSTGSNQLAATIMSNNETPWYLTSDIDSNEIVYSMEGKVKGGTLHALVQYLTQHNQLDSKFNTTFLLTYRSFCTTQELFNELFNRYQLTPPENLTLEELKLVRLRVFNVIKSWLEVYYNEEEDRPILPEISHFTENIIIESMKFGAEQLTKLIKKRLLAEDSSQIRKMKLNIRTADMPIPILPKNMRRIKLLELDPHELARQMTIMDFRLYNCIKPVECLDKNWGKPDTDQDHIAANVKASIEHSNQVTAWVTDSILSKEEVKKRASVLKHWIFVAERCRLLNNYNTCMAILSAFDNGSIGRLKRTWDFVSARTLQILQNIRRLMGANRNFSEYRDIIHKVNPPCIPFLGIYLQDLTFIEDGNSNFLKKSNHLINFAKRMKTAEVIQDLQQYQSTHYMLTAVPDIQQFIKTHLQSSREEEELYNLSLKLEPRERGEDTIARRLKESGL
ncbi:ras guanine nucleotide exchange factor domain-containing protein [Cokeromyces recurvatus]|uniref:ras guanine nucleotide exchange factor domain-containing protein n=1 Tax=Cokeromyces recurvatus TaxID=90255 RepID=UPI00221E5C66|nr:ras guanine nucleotide exchange factor domain-containing protein [Cokeromyces recurvatus]KAI7901110.1 ras guanine nucleotide exchange factor domain-containing protein [Cokeromyces recurvatus]